MNYASIIIPFVGGLGMFIYGMQIMAAGLENAAGNRMKTLLEVLTKNKFFGVLLGAFITAVIQSSSATTVMVVGFVNAGIMNLTQAMGVIMGANVGTTVTGWLVSSVEWAKFLSPATLAPIAIMVGVVIMLIGKRRSTKDIASIIIGFGLLFVGITTMSAAVAPLKESASFCHAFVTLGKSPLLGILAGAGVTAIIQSSSASVGILQSLAAAGLVPMSAAIYIIMGQNIGTCVTAMLSSMGAKKNAKTAALMHLLFNIIGTVIFSIIAIVVFKLINPSLGTGNITQTEISIVHTIFNIGTTILLFPVSDLIIKLAKKIGHAEEDVKDDSQVLLDARMLQTPSIALQS
ncbi:MAG: Na/Pi cotransporter family protein, partial [Lachnospiraceae bacterium]